MISHRSSATRSPWVSVDEGGSDQLTAPCSVIHRRMSSTRQTVTLGESLTGSGNVFASTRRHSVDFEIGTNCSTCVWRRKPVSGRRKLSDSRCGDAELRATVDGNGNGNVDGDGERMIRPLRGSCRTKVMTCTVAAALGQGCARPIGNVRSSVTHRRCPARRMWMQFVRSR